MLRILLIPYIFIEIVFIILFVGEYGFFAYFLEVTLTAVIGIIFAFKHGILKIFESTFLTPLETIKTFGASVGGFLILLPGILCDITGLVIFIFWLIYTKDDSKYFHDDNQNDNIIDVEIINEDKK